jgi:G3E family GTPase
MTAPTLGPETLPTPLSTPVPLTIVGGFLGSGKTSLLNHILSNSTGRRIAVLVNDFGAINIDAKLIVSVEGDTVSLANGCVCCTIRDDLLKGVIELVGRGPLPDHIVIETSGVARPVAVAETFLSPAAQGLVDVHHMISVLDADLTVDPAGSYGDLAFDQIKVADIVVINKTDLIARGQLAALRQRVETLAPRARVLETVHGIVPLELVFDDHLALPRTTSAAMNDVRNGEARAHDHHEHGPEGRFEAWSYRDDAAWSFKAIERAVTGLPKGIYRAKGTIRLDVATGDHGIFHLTGRRSWLRLREPRDGETVSTELIFIGERGATTNESLRACFERTFEEVRRRGDEGYIMSDLRAFDVVFA